MRETFVQSHIAPQQKMWVLDTKRGINRGIEVLVPPQSGNQQPPHLEGERLAVIAEDPITKKRYPRYESGARCMDNVDYKRRQDLLRHAISLSDHIRTKWQEINPHKPIAVVLFGSVARGLTRGAHHPDPSNIDLSVIGDFTNEETDNLYNAIREKRNVIQKSILEKCQAIYSQEDNPGNAGVHIQTIEKVKNSVYGDALRIIGSSGYALYDPEQIWHNIETEALTFSREKRQKIRRFKADRTWIAIEQSVLFEAKNDMSR